MRPQHDPWEKFWLTGSIRDYLAACRRDVPPSGDTPDRGRVPAPLERE